MTEETSFSDQSLPNIVAQYSVVTAGSHVGATLPVGVLAVLLCHLLLLQSVISEIHARSRVLQTGGPSPWTIRLSTSSHASLLREFLIISSPQQIPSYEERPEAEPPAAEVQDGPPSQFFISAQFPLIRL